MVITSWKEIAEYLHCGVRTAQRWERNSQLPVARPNRAKRRSPVVALTQDIDAWVRRKKEGGDLTSDVIWRHRHLIEALNDSLKEQQRLLSTLSKCAFSMSDATQQAQSLPDLQHLTEPPHHFGAVKTLLDGIDVH